VVAASARPEHATESEVIRDGLRVPMAKVRARLAAKHKKSAAKA
jgi:hypothetical protein